MLENTHVIIINGVPQQVTSEAIATIEQQAAETAAESQLAYQANIPALRQSAYQAEADPLFFKMQRGEATQAEWLAKILEIKQRYPN